MCRPDKHLQMIPKLTRSNSDVTFSLVLLAATGRCGLFWMLSMPTFVVLQKNSRTSDSDGVHKYTPVGCWTDMLDLLSPNVYTSAL